MEFKTISGSIKRVKNIRKRVIDWEAPSKSKRQREVKKFLKNTGEVMLYLKNFQL